MGRIACKMTTSDLLGITIFRMNLTPGYRYTLKWLEGEREAASIRYEVSELRITFLYRYLKREGVWHDVEKSFFLTFTDCNYGGNRPWFVCDCGRRVGRLFLRRQHIACRHCWNLAYECQREQPIGRQIRKIHRLERQLKENGPHMRSKTLERAVFRLRLAEFHFFRHLKALCGEASH